MLCGQVLPCPAAPLARAEHEPHVSIINAHDRALSEVIDVKASGQCPKCGNKEINVKSKQVWPLLLFGTLVVDLHICEGCGYIETYENSYKKTKKGRTA